MPYLPGNSLVDAAGNALLDLSDVRLGEPPFDLGQLVADVRALALDLLMSFGPFSTLADGLRTIINDLLGTTPARDLSTMDYVESIYAILDPANLTDGHLPAHLDANQTQALAAIQAVRQDLTSPHLPTIEDVLGVIGSGPGVELPETPPAGYGGSTDAQIWGYYLPDVAGGGATASYALSVAWQLAHRMFLAGGWPIEKAPHFQMEQNDIISVYWPTDFAGLTYDLTDIHADDTVLSWLTRTDTSGREWQLDEVRGLVYTETNLSGENHTRITCRLTDADLQAIRAGYAAGGTLVANVPPIWPGVAGVTLGSSVPLASSVTLTGPLHGVLVAVTTPPSGLGLKNIGGNNYWYRLGEITFASDNGDLEPPQYLGFESALYTPKSMTEASAAYLRVMGAAAGTATPYTITT